MVESGSALVLWARLSSSDFPALTRLTSREADDAAIALLDAWATVGDVLTYWSALAPDTVFDGIKSLPPGHTLTVEDETTMNEDGPVAEAEEARDEA